MHETIFPMLPIVEYCCLKGLADHSSQLLLIWVIHSRTSIFQITSSKIIGHWPFLEIHQLSPSLPANTDFRCYQVNSGTGSDCAGCTGVIIHYTVGITCGPAPSGCAGVLLVVVVEFVMRAVIVLHQPFLITSGKLLNLNCGFSPLGGFPKWGVFPFYFSPISS